MSEQAPSNEVHFMAWEGFETMEETESCVLTLRTDGTALHEVTRIALFEEGAVTMLTRSVHRKGTWALGGTDTEPTVILKVHETEEMEKRQMRGGLGVPTEVTQKISKRKKNYTFPVDLAGEIMQLPKDHPSLRIKRLQWSGVREGLPYSAIDKRCGQ